MISRNDFQGTCSKNGLVDIRQLASSVSSATVNLPTAVEPLTLYVTLSSPIAGSWQARAYSYTVDPRAGGASPTKGNPATGASISNSGTPEMLGFLFIDGDAHFFKSCTVGDPQITARPVGPPQTVSACNVAFCAISIEFTATRSVAPGQRDVSCHWADSHTSKEVSVEGGVSVYDASPYIDTVRVPPDQPNSGWLYIEICGGRFG